MKKLVAVFLSLLMILSISASLAQTEVSVWTWSPIPRTMEKMIQAFEQENADIKVKYTNYNYNPEYLAALAAGAGSNNMGDILGLQPGSLTQQYREYLLDLTEFAKEKWGEDWESKIYGINTKQMRLGNPDGDKGVYIIPVESQIINIFYNTKIFEKLSLSVPQTWDELKDVAAKLTAAGYAPLYFGGADGWQHVNLFMMLATQFGDQIFAAQDGSGSWEDESLLKAMTAYKDMFDSGIVQVGALSNNAYPDGVSLFKAGKVGMMALGSWWFQEKTAPDAVELVKDWSFANFYLPPCAEGATFSPPVGGMDFGYGISKNCADPKAAWEVLSSFAAGTGNQAAIDDLNNLPAFKGIVPNNVDTSIKEQVEKFAGELDSAKNQRIASPEIEAALQSVLQGVAAGELEPAAALKQMQETQNKVLGK